MADEVIGRAILELGVTGLADARAQVGTLEGNLKRLEAAYKAGTIPLNQYLAQSASLQSQIAQLSGGISAAEAAVKKFGSAQAGAAGLAKQMGQGVQKAGTSGAMGLMILSQTVDDMQYGFKSIVNNMPQVGMAIAGAFGAGAKAGMILGGVMGIVGVGINLLITHWDQLMSLMGLGKVKTEAEEMEELGKKAGKTADEIAKLNKYTKEQKEVAKIHDLESEEQREVRSRVEKVYGEAGTGDVRGVLAGQMKRPLLPDEEAIIKAAGDAELAKLTQPIVTAGGGNMPVMNAPRPISPAEQAAAEKRRDDAMQAKRAEINAKIQNEALAEADKRMAKATQSDAEGKLARQEIENRLKQAGRPQLAAKLGETSPEAIRAERDRRDEMAIRKEATDREIREANERQARIQNEAGRVSGMMMHGAAGESLLGATRLPKGMTAQQDLETKIRSAMEAAGLGAEKIGELLPSVAEKLKENVEKQIQERVATGQAPTRDVARAQLLREERMRDIRARGGSMEGSFTSGAEAIFNKLQLSATHEDVFKAAGGIPEQQLKAQEEGNKKLDNITAALLKAKASDVPRFGPVRR